MIRQKFEQQPESLVDRRIVAKKADVTSSQPAAATQKSADLRVVIVASYNSAKRCRWPQGGEVIEC